MVYISGRCDIRSMQGHAMPTTVYNNDLLSHTFVITDFQMQRFGKAGYNFI